MRAGRRRRSEGDHSDRRALALAASSPRSRFRSVLTEQFFHAKV